MCYACYKPAKRGQRKYYEPPTKARGKNVRVCVRGVACVRECAGCSSVLVCEWCVGVLFMCVCGDTNAIGKNKQQTNHIRLHTYLRQRGHQGEFTRKHCARNDARELGGVETGRVGGRALHAQQAQTAGLWRQLSAAAHCAHLHAWQRHCNVQRCSILHAAPAQKNKHISANKKEYVNLLILISMMCKQS